MVFMHDSASNRNQRKIPERNRKRDSRNGEETWNHRCWGTYRSNSWDRSANNFRLHDWGDTRQNPERRRGETWRQDPSNKDRWTRRNSDSCERQGNTSEEERRPRQTVETCKKLPGTNQRRGRGPSYCKAEGCPCV